ncbi:YybH family protein [Microbacterium invictum]|uniref:Nuclear transport factor 2 family protein n=1 Tax=Microbacterium invictum TaxID=515415 RepID=A0ABZ0VCK9_9MICO|nr:nuclear transport factor 2 family protein [Microbacterium invictum]WQB71219.1 nuclear transport factor 2 family protein [Microbacterium invictum]
MSTEPLRMQTQALLDAVNALDLEALRAMVDDDYGIVDVDPQGRSVVIDSTAEWEAYMATNFAAMRTAGAVLSSRVVGYHGEEAGDLGYSVVRFVQRVEIGDSVIENPCIATIVWKRTPGGWKEARWHCSPAPV